ncbi:MAG: iron-containing redox enzyme family protein [Actinomycetota bacterium]|nr:iron-containing redox enzyme family protein [Actinomycetota bacterium]
MLVPFRIARENGASITEVAMTSTLQLTARLDEAVARHRLLDHPFYRAWTKGSLTGDDLAFYSTQYWRQVQAFPGYLETLAPRMAEPSARRALETNLADETGGDHPGLWVSFANALGIARSTLDETPPEPETVACVAAFQEACAGALPAFAVGMLYGYESQTPEIATTKATGLREHYGLEGDSLAYFELHGRLDIEHSKDLVGAIAAESKRDGGQEGASSSGARAGASAIWGLLDGVARVRGIG